MHTKYTNSLEHYASSVKIRKLSPRKWTSSRNYVLGRYKKTSIFAIVFIYCKMVLFRHWKYLFSHKPSKIWVFLYIFVVLNILERHQSMCLSTHSITFCISHWWVWYVTHYKKSSFLVSHSTHGQVLLDSIYYKYARFPCYLFASFMVQQWKWGFSPLWSYH